MAVLSFSLHSALCFSSLLCHQALFWPLPLSKTFFSFFLCSRSSSVCSSFLHTCLAQHLQYFLYCLHCLQRAIQQQNASLVSWPDIDNIISHFPSSKLWISLWFFVFLGPWHFVLTLFIPWTPCLTWFGAFMSLHMHVQFSVRRESLRLL